MGVQYLVWCEKLASSWIGTEGFEAILDDLAKPCSNVHSKDSTSF